MTKTELADRIIKENGGAIRITRKKLSRILRKRVSNIDYLFEDLPKSYSGRGYAVYFVDDVVDAISKKGLKG